MDKNPKKIKEMFNQIAQNYDVNNNLISFGLHKIIKKNVINSFKFSGDCLDLCTGTGDIAELLKKQNCNVVGLDFSKNMLEIARKKHSDIKFIEGDCTSLPFDNNTFDNVTISFGLRNIENYDKALDEIYRVLKPDGYFLHLDFCKKNWFANIIYNFVVPKLIKIFYGNNQPYIYLVQSKKDFFDDDKLTEIFYKHGFEVNIQKTFLLGTISCKYCHKSQIV